MSRTNVVVVTGAAGGIGRAIAEKFASEGAALAICDLNASGLQDAAEKLGRQTAVFSSVLDVTDAEAVQDFVDETIMRYGSIDVLANNAGIAPVASFLEMPLSLWEKTIDVNLKGMFIMAQAVAKKMMASGSGAIINMSSTNGLFAEEKLAAYNASKAGVIMLTRTMALELANHGIRVNAVCPGFIATELARNSGFDESFLSEYASKIPLGRPGTCEEVAELFLFLSSSKSSFITGQCVIIDGVQTIGQ
jgi:3-oxoacyl-[acyl-carrier protein] reductase